MAADTDKSDTQDSPFHSFTGFSETTEPVNGHVPDTPSKVDPPTQAPPLNPTVLRPPRLPGLVSKSATNSPKASRESSPVRPTIAARGLRSRKNSQDKSPSRASGTSGPSSNPPSIPSAAAVQRALSAANVTSLLPNSSTDSTSKTGKAGKRDNADANDATPHWPTSPRLRSPPPANPPGKVSSSNRKADSTNPPPRIVVQRNIPISNSATTLTSHHPSALDADLEDHGSPLVMRSSARGASAAGSTLETVQEGSLPASTADAPRRSRHTSKLSDDDKPEKITENTVEESLGKGTTLVTESESEGGGPRTAEKAQRRPATASSAEILPSKGLGPSRSFVTLASKSKPGGEPLVQNMTVETETVSSIPQVAVGGGAGERGGPGRVEGGIVRTKPSTETIRPKKDKKKTGRKTPSLQSGMASSKADVFEAKVASAVDEANSTDSEETFVYESNPPDPHPSRSGRHHSRTPSATSVHAAAESQRGGRGGTMNGNHSIGGKRSMKFAHNHYGTTATEDASSTPTTPASRLTENKEGGNSHRYHIGQWGRPGKNQHTSLFDSESPFPPGSKLLRAGNGHGSRQSSRATSPRHPHHLKLNGIHDKKSSQVASYDLDVEGADDERTPLMGSVRVSRSRAHRTPGSASQRQAEYNESRHRNWLTRFAGCLVLTILIILVISGAMGFLFATTKALYGVRVHEIQNVLASEQEIMLDLLVEAVNPNVISVTISDMDVNVFAKSRYVGTGAFWRDHRPSTERARRRRKQLGGPDDAPYHTANGVDEGNDPIEDPEGDPQTMLLGRIFEFDSALTLDGSPIKRHPSFSVGEVRLAKPGNKTEEGGTERWERVIKHPFELIIRGVLKYQLPLSSRIRTAPIGASALVHPEQGVDEMGNMRIEMLRELPGSNVRVDLAWLASSAASPPSHPAAPLQE